MEDKQIKREDELFDKYYEKLLGSGDKFPMNFISKIEIEFLDFDKTNDWFLATITPEDIIFTKIATLNEKTGKYEKVKE